MCISCTCMPLSLTGVTVVTCCWRLLESIWSGVCVSCSCSYKLLYCELLSCHYNIEFKRCELLKANVVASDPRCTYTGLLGMHILLYSGNHRATDTPNRPYNTCLLYQWCCFVLHQAESPILLMSTSSPDIIGVMNASRPSLFFSFPIFLLGNWVDLGGIMAIQQATLMNTIPLEPCLANGGPNFTRQQQLEHW